MHVYTFTNSYDICLSTDNECVTGNVRLAGEVRNSGLLEVCVNGRWGTVCGHQNETAVVVCRQLNLPTYRQCRGH